MTRRRRLDAELVRRGLSVAVDEAREQIEGHRVLVGGAVATNAAHLVGPDEPVVVTDERDRYVGRGGHKLGAALERWAVPVAGRRAIDVGASTGGFTDCLLQRGAVEVVAVDVGKGQLHERLRADARVVSRERTDVRDVDPEDLGGRAPIVVADLSFISLTVVAPHLLNLVQPGGDLIVLVKPQFEATRRETSRGGGVIGDRSVWRRVLDEVASSFHAAGAVMMGAMPSPLRGAHGNVEFLLRLGRPPAGATAIDLDAVVAAVDGG